MLGLAGEGRMGPYIRGSQADLGEGKLGLVSRPLAWGRAEK